MSTFLFGVIRTYSCSIAQLSETVWAAKIQHVPLYRWRNVALIYPRSTSDDTVYRTDCPHRDHSSVFALRLRTLCQCTVCVYLQCLHAVHSLRILYYCCHTMWSTATWIVLKNTSGRFEKSGEITERLTLSTALWLLFMCSLWVIFPSNLIHRYK